MHAYLCVGPDIPLVILRYGAGAHCSSSMVQSPFLVCLTVYKYIPIYTLLYQDITEKIGPVHNQLGLQLGAVGCMCLS